MAQDDTSAGAVDREALDAFLATAPAELSDWAEAQREALDEPPARPATKQPKPSIAKNINKVLVALLAAAVVLLVKEWGSPATAETAASEAPHEDLSGMTGGVTDFVELDQAKVDELLAAIEANPQDNAKRHELATMYNEAGLWDDAGAQYEAILANDPEDLDALLAFGVVQFNFGNMDGAIETWTKASEVAPDRPEPLFNLGFAHLAAEPSDEEAAKAAWQKVIDLDPDSELAQTAQNHIDGVNGER